MIFVYLKKAFDTVDHEILLKRLKKYGVIGTENACFASYLRSKIQFCRVNGMSSGLDDIIFEFHRALVSGPYCF